MARLILHSDDLGLHLEVNRGIFTAAEEGVLTSASLLVNGAAVADAAGRARGCPQLGVGLHLNIVRGRPLADASQMPTLVNREGRFLNSMWALLWRSVCGRLSADDIYREYRCQYLRMREYGLEPTHIDGEKHSHLLLPEATHAVKRLAEEFRIAKIRIISERPLIRVLRSRGIALRVRPAQRLKLRMLEHRAESAKATWSALKSPDASFGVLISGADGIPSGPAVVRALLALESPRTIEWMFHLGFPAELDSPAFRAEFGDFFLTGARSKELEFLRSAPVQQAIHDAGGNIISYREL